MHTETNLYPENKRIYDILTNINYMLERLKTKIPLTFDERQTMCNDIISCNDMEKTKIIKEDIRRRQEGGVTHV